MSFLWTCYLEREESDKLGLLKNQNNDLLLNICTAVGKDFSTTALLFHFQALGNSVRSLQENFTHCIKLNVSKLWPLSFLRPWLNPTLPAFSQTLEKWLICVPVKFNARHRISLHWTVAGGLSPFGVAKSSMLHCQNIIRLLKVLVCFLLISSHTEEGLLRCLYLHSAEGVTLCQNGGNIRAQMKSNSLNMYDFRQWNGWGA